MNLLLSFDQKRLWQIVSQMHQIECPRSNLLPLLHLESVPIFERISSEPFWIHQNEIRHEGMKVCIFLGPRNFLEKWLKAYEIQGGEIWRRRTNSEWLRNQVFPLFLNSWLILENVPRLWYCLKSVPVYKSMPKAHFTSRINNVKMKMVYFMVFFVCNYK